MDDWKTDRRPLYVRALESRRLDDRYRLYKKTPEKPPEEAYETRASKSRRRSPD
jgi:hypothetical protein